MRPSFGDEEVLGLEIAMHDALLVRRRQAARDLHARSRSLCAAGAAAPRKWSRRRLAFEQLGDQIGRAVLLADVIDGENVGMVEAPTGRASCSKRRSRSVSR